MRRNIDGEIKRPGTEICLLCKNIISRIVGILGLSGPPLSPGTEHPLLCLGH